MFGNNEDVTTMKINTHGGQDAFVYFVQKIPTFFECDKIIYPTGLLRNITYFYPDIFYITILLDALLHKLYSLHCDWFETFSECFSDLCLTLIFINYILTLCIYLTL